MKQRMNPQPSMNDHIRRQAARYLPDARAVADLKILTDTSDFFSVDYGSVLLLDGKGYLVRQNAKEGRFGIDEQEKFWVKRAVDLETDRRKIIKLVFNERFTAHVGDIAFECFRSPRKESRILALVGDHPHFMHGCTVNDTSDNIVRIIDFIYGKPLSAFIEEIDAPHDIYFREHFPGILDHFTACVNAIGFLHDRGEKHGDIRRDHILIDRENSQYRWIDFDFNYRHRENIYGYDLFGLGNILIFLAGRGDVILSDLKTRDPSAYARLREDDLNIVFNHRVANLKKVYPYIPEKLNRILLHFSKGAGRFYDHTRQLLEDLKDYRREAGTA